MIASLGNHLKNITTSVLLKTGRNFVSSFFSSLVAVNSGVFQSRGELRRLVGYYSK